MARAGDRTRPLYDDDSDPDTEPDTPKFTKSGIRKRISEAYAPDHDASFVSDSGARGAHKSVDINDDAAEKRRRRKSTKIAVTESLQVGNDGQDQPDTSRTAKLKQQLTTIALPSGPEEPLDILSTKYEEWMKIATDNKITVANTWNFALIDYFHEMSLLRNTDDNSINFQRASHTLDGCVKIWTSRVDSVGTETAKLASNLASGGTVDDDDEAGSDDPDGEQIKEKKKRNHRSGATLAKDASQLRIKKLDLEFSVDPLFRKTCADFDEGGAQGLLMNHLSLGVGQDGGLRVVFDASDSVSKVEEEEDIQEPEELIDLTQLRSEFLPDINVLEDKAISHSLADFSFSKNTFSNDDTFFQDNTQQDDDDDDDFGADIPMDNEVPPEEDFFVGDDAVADDYGGGNMMGGDEYGDHNSNGSVGPTDDGQGGQSGSFVPFDPRQMPQQRDLVLAMNEDGGEAMDYFDKTFLKNWAGPEHWKMRKVVRRPEADPAATKAAKPRKEKKEPNRIDFLTPSEKDWKEISKELFAGVTKGASINLPGTSATAKKRKGKDEKKRENHCLPDDMHFSKKQLVSLFLKPKFSLKMRGRKTPGANNEGDIDENFWAQAAADQAAGRNRDEDFDETSNGGAIPFNTQFFHDDFDDGPGFDDPYDGDGGDGADPLDPGEQDLLSGTQGPTRRVKVERIKYTKRAKRVDVRKLKENIWQGLDIVVSPPKQADDEGMDVDDNVPPPTDPSEARPFTSVISNLQQSYPREKMQDISTSFCFICLLHLANEQGLRLECDGVRSSENDNISDTKIGSIWDLKVYRDPDATQVA